jgi:IclR family KDG regulon transcriptional repressor
VVAWRQMAAGARSVADKGDRAVDPPPSRYRVQAARKILELLEAIAARPEPRTLPDLASATGLPRATAFRLLRTLEESGFARRVSGGYGLGSKSQALGDAARSGLDLRSEALPFLEWLRDVSGETSQLAVLEEWQIVYLERVLSGQPVGYMRSRAGAILPAYCTGLGKALLAFQPREKVAIWASKQTFTAMTPNTLITAEALLDELVVIRDLGYALDREERELGVRCIAAPVRDHDDAVVAAISIAGPSERMPRDLVGSQLASQVLDAAEGISRRLGYRGNAYELMARRTRTALPRPD